MALERLRQALGINRNFSFKRGPKADGLKTPVAEDILDYLTWDNLINKKATEASDKNFPARFVSDNGYFTIYIQGEKEDRCAIVVRDFEPKFEGEVHRDALVLKGDNKIHYLEYTDLEAEDWLMDYPEDQKPERYWPNWHDGVLKGMGLSSLYYFLKEAELFDPNIAPRIFSRAGTVSPTAADGWKGKVLDRDAILRCIDEASVQS